jgi:hypothetical protein
LPRSAERVFTGILLLALACPLASCSKKDPSGSPAPGAGSGGAGGDENILPVAYGEWCPKLSDGSITRVSCEGGKGICAKLGALAYGVCTHTCEVQADCPPTFRCTESSTGRHCVERCSTTGDCDAVEGVLCAATATPGEGVCWYGQENEGELTFAGKLIISSVEWLDAEHGSWRMEPGSKVQVIVGVRNVGNAFVGGTVTFASRSPHLTVTETIGPHVAITTYKLWPTTYAGSISSDSDIGLAVPLDLEISPSAPWGEALPLVIVLTDGVTGVATELTLSPMARKPALAFEMNPAAKQGGPVNGNQHVSITARHVGYGGARAVTVNSTFFPAPEQVTYAGDTQKITDGAYEPVDLPLGSAYISLSSSTSYDLTSNVTEPGGGSWSFSTTFSLSDLP